MMRCNALFGLLVLLGVLAPVEPVSGQSLWKRSEKKLSEEKSKKPSSIYVRKTATRESLKKNDIILVIVLEEASASNDARLDANRKLETEFLLDEFVRFSGTQDTEQHQDGAGQTEGGQNSESFLEQGAHESLLLAQRRTERQELLLVRLDLGPGTDHLHEHRAVAETAADGEHETSMRPFFQNIGTN